MSLSASPIERVERAIAEIRAGRMVILVDDEDRENEGDLVLAADKVTPEAINFMATHARGLICLAMDGPLIDRLELPMMVRNNQATLGTAFTVSIEARRGVTTGISARDRAVTIQAAIADDARPEDIVSPGHVFPLRARAGGVLVRTGQTEGSVDLARMAGLKPAGVICEIMRDDGEMARLPELEEFGQRHGLLVCTVADMIAYRLQREHIVAAAGRGRGPARLARRRARRSRRRCTRPTSSTPSTSRWSAATSRRRARPGPRSWSGSSRSIPSAIRSACGPTSTPPCAPSTTPASASSSTSTTTPGPAWVGRSSAWSCSARCRRAKSDQSSEALRDFGLGAQVLADLGCRKIRLMSHSDRRIPGIEGFGIEVVERVAMPVSRPRPVVGGKGAPDAEAGPRGGPDASAAGARRRASPRPAR